MQNYDALTTSKQVDTCVKQFSALHTEKVI